MNVKNITDKLGIMTCTYRHNHATRHYTRVMLLPTERQKRKKPGEKATDDFYFERFRKQLRKY